MTSTWREVPLMDLCRPKQWPTISTSQLSPSGFPVYGANGRIGFFTEYNHEHPTILITCRGATCGTVNICESQSYVTGNAMALDDLDTERADLRFLYYALISRGLDDTITGSAQPQITRETLKRVSVLLPSTISEQQRIAAILDKADGIRRKRNEAIALTEELLRSAFLEMVGPQATRYSRWPIQKIEELAADTPNSMRTGPFGSDLRHSEFVDEGVAVLGIDNAVQNKFAWGERRFITNDKYENLKRYTVYPDDVIITIMGTVGRSAVVPSDVPTAITSKHLATITLNRELVEPEFLSQAIHRHPEVLAQIERANRGAIMNGLNLGLIRSLELRVPPKDIQSQFTTWVSRVRSMEDCMSRAVMETDALFASLVHDAFRGELTPRTGRADRQLDLFQTKGA